MAQAFDPMTEIPRTDEEVMIALQRNDEIVTCSLQGIYQCLRGQGKSLIGT